MRRFDLTDALIKWNKTHTSTLNCSVMNKNTHGHIFLNLIELVCIGGVVLDEDS